MSTQPDYDWIDLLQVAKAIRRNAKPVAPSAGFRRHLRRDLATALGTSQADLPIQIGVRRQGSAVIFLGLCLGFLMAILVFLLMFLRPGQFWPHTRP